MLCSKSYCDICGTIEGPFLSSDGSDFGGYFETLTPNESDIDGPIPEDLLELFRDAGIETFEDEDEVVCVEPEDMPDIGISIILDGDGFPTCMCKPCFASHLRSIANSLDPEGE